MFTRIVSEHSGGVILTARLESAFMEPPNVRKNWVGQKFVPWAVSVGAAEKPSNVELLDDIFSRIDDRLIAGLFSNGFY